MRIFTMDDQLRFAQLSGDHNPLHTDPDWASTRYPGQVVIHGVHVLLWALDATLKQERIPALSVTFIKPVIIGDKATAQFDGHILTVSVRGEMVMRAKTGGVENAASNSPSTPVAPDSVPWLGRTGTVLLPSESSALANEFPAASRVLGKDGVKGLAALSTLVGMECPGLGGIFSGFSVSFEERESRLNYCVSRFDQRCSQITMQVVGYGVNGEVVAHVDPQPSVDIENDIVGKVDAGEFAGQRPLIVGGSSGLGKAAALLLATGGAEPIITYNRSIAQAQAIAQRVEAMGRRCDLLQFDIEKCEQGFEIFRDRDWDIRQIYYFASPRIFRRRLETYQAADAHEFMRVYVDGFYELVRAAMKRDADQKLSVFYPSTLAIDEAAPDMFEYAMAKQCGELLCARLQKKYKYLTIRAVRLPRIITRQTQSFLKVAALPPEDVLLPYIREIQRGK